MAKWTVKLKRVSQWPKTDLLLAGITIVLLGIARLAVLTLPFRWIAPRIGKVGEETAIGGLNSAEKQAVRRVSKIVNSVSRHTPWNSNCLPQAIVTAHILRRRNIPHTVYFGIDRDWNTVRSNDIAHAWVRSGRFFVVGGNGSSHVAVATFANKSR